MCWGGGGILVFFNIVILNIENYINHFTNEFKLFLYLHFQAQIVLLMILLAAMFDFLAGSVLIPNEEQIAQGFHGWNGKITLYLV